MMPVGISRWRNRWSGTALPWARYLGIDRAIFYTLLNRGWSALAGPFSLIFIARFLTREEQGFYYTFSSVLALQVFFELGLAFVIMQSVSHEKAHLEWSADDSILIGDPRAKARLASLFRFALKWYVVIASLATLALVPIGFCFFGRYQPADKSISWELPWVMVVLATGLNLAMTPFLGVLEGCNKVSEIAGLQARQAIIGSPTFWLTISLHFKLYATPVLSAVSIIITTSWLIRKRRLFFLDLWRTPIPVESAIKWRREIMPFQWKVAVSWLSGYFALQLGNPVMFRYHGAVEAGRLGMSLRIIDSIIALSFAWVGTKSAPFGSYIARKDFKTLDIAFKKAFNQSLAAITGCLSIFLIAYGLLWRVGFPYINRVLDFPSLCFMSLNAVIVAIFFNLAVYLRAHKEEPFLLNSIAGAILIPLVMYFLGRPYGAIGMTAGILGVHLFIGLPWASWVFFAKRREWHNA